MHFQYSLLGFGALTVVHAAVVPRVEQAVPMWKALASTPGAQNAGYRIDQVQNGYVNKNGPAQIAGTFEKFGKPVPSHVKAAAAAVQSSRVVASPEPGDAAYICPMYIGSQKALVGMDFDTGSSDTWVFSNLQPSSQLTGHHYYTPSKSTSASLQSGETWSITYGDGSGAGGVVYSDTIVVGAVTATSAAVEAATSASSALIGDTKRDGLVGFASPGLNNCSPNKCTTFFYGVGHSFPLPVLTAALKPGKAGSYDLGFINSTKYTGSLQYASIDQSSPYWTVPFTGYAVGSTTTTTSYEAIVDTGTTLVYLPDSIVNSYYAKVAGSQNSASAGGWIFPCSSSLPSFSIVLNSVSYTIPGSYMAWSSNGAGTCFGSLQSSNGIGINILGDCWLKFQFVVFDYGNLRVGLAKQSAN